MRSALQNEAQAVKTKYVMSDSSLSELFAAVDSSPLLPESKKNLKDYLGGSSNPVDHASVRELVETKQWNELDDRFFKTLAFGTGGLRGRTVGRVITAAERGNATDGAAPEFPCAGTNAMNFYNVSRATQGLAHYVREWHISAGRAGRPAVCICHDTRYFSRAFAELAARILADLGCDAFLFESFRPTPELSFAIRMTGAAAGINITASHNPPAYNGYKVYFADGGQIIEPHASGIIARVRAVERETYEPLPEASRGVIRSLGAEVDAAYLERLATLVLEPETICSATDLKIVYSPLHGTGATIIEPLLKTLGFRFSMVASQCVPDGGFPTVKSPNPEEKEALDLAIQQAENEGADLVIATDPDADRMGVAVRGADGSLTLLTGNQIGSIMAWHRISRFFALGILNDANKSRAAIIKTFVTTDLQQAIAERFGLKCVNTLTGFKYIGAKLTKYEQQIPAALREGYFSLPEEKTRALRLEHSTFFVFGGEESYGYSGADFVRDKDANSAVVMLAEAAAFAKAQGKTLLDLLDSIYCEFGYYLERGESLTLEGAEGAAQISRIIASYAANPPSQLAGRAVLGIKNFATETIYDEEGDEIPKENMLMFDLQGGYRFAVRPSGTEPKIKFYLFARETGAGSNRIEPAELPTVKQRARDALDALWQAIRADVETRKNG
jgi:phosphoglucomutase